MAKNFLLLVFAISFSLSSCMVIRSGIPPTVASYASLQKVDCAVPPDQVHLFFEGEASDFSYTKLGVLEVRGNDEASLEDLLEHLRYTAWEHCANGIIHVKKEYRTVEGDLDIDDESIDIRSELVYSGIAVNIQKGPEFYEKYGQQADTKFIYNTERRLREQEEEEKTISIGNTFVTIAGGLLVLILIFSLQGI